MLSIDSKNIHVHPWEIGCVEAYMNQEYPMVTKDKKNYHDPERQPKRSHPKQL